MLLTKEILPAGTYVVNSPEGRVKREFTPESLSEMASTANAMLDAGLKIPIPYNHRKDAFPIEVNKEPASPEHNAGYWQRYFIAPNKDNLPTLFGLTDLPGSDNDPNSAYYKAKNTATEVSVSMRDKFIDGLGRVWKNAILHTALVNHPVVPGQEGFKDVPDGSIVLSLSSMDNDCETDTEAIGLISKLKQVLLEAVKIQLPDNCTPKTVLRDLLTAASQIKAMRPDGQQLEHVPIFMSITGGQDMKLTLDQAKSIVATNAPNPVTGKPYTLADLGHEVAPSVDMSALQTQLGERDTKIAQLSALVKALTTNASATIQASVANRIAALVNKGVITKDYATAQLQPKIAFELSLLSDGTITPHPLETTLSALEAAPTPAIKPQAPTPVALPYNDTSAPLEENTLKSILDEVMSS